MSNNYLREIDLLSVWEVAHRWVELHPDQTNPEDLPEILTDKVREILSVLGSYLNLYDETGDPEYDRSIPFTNIAVDNEALQRANRIMLKRQYPKDDLDSLYITRYEVKKWCVHTFDYLPPFWFTDNEIDEHNQFLGQYTNVPIPASKSLSKDQATKIKCQNLAKKLWAEDATINISNMANHLQIIGICMVKKNGYNDDTRRRWVREVSPSHLKGKSGRPKKH